MPFPPDKGERVRAFHEIEALSRHFEVTLASLSHPEQQAGAATALERWCAKVLTAPAGGKVGLIRGAAWLLAGKSVTEGYFRSGRLAQAITEENGRQPFDLVLGYSSSVLPYVMSLQNVPSVIDLVDVDSAKWVSYAESARWPMRWLYRREARGVAELEALAVKSCQAVLLVSQAEARMLASTNGNVMAVKNGVDVDFFSPGTTAPADIGRAGLVFTGTMDYRPNVEGVCWFVREVWPEIRRQEPEATFTIVGRDPAPAVRKLTECPGVAVTGSVPDVRPYLEAARMAVCPLQIARGVQNKVLEAMSMAKAVVASSAGIEGLDVEVGRHLLCADSPDQWQEHILSLLKDSSARDELGLAAREHVQANYAWGPCMESLVEICKDICEADAP